MFAQLWLRKPEEGGQAQSYSVRGIRTAVAGGAEISTGRVESDNGM
ncbi:hypothetical protein P3W85_03040 [Cupriavidus basilensis]|uniref:Uncharacterized protein n=1 Tax=Cupriavidus basilensis TaxID=68895 RepID=A0ABT6AH64_9BURK|nr:hypothetical protein [Cupriavidus basilensis]MDF3831935.1 hypothetical protein [Cupriavidus basilensis]